MGALTVTSGVMDRPNDNAPVARGVEAKQEAASATLIALHRRPCNWCGIGGALRCNLCLQCWRWLVRDLLLLERASEMRRSPEKNSGLYRLAEFAGVPFPGGFSTIYRWSVPPRTVG